MRSPAVAALGWAVLLAASPASAAGDPATGLPGPDALAPLVRLGPVERQTPESLWERIDGEAELYRTYGLAASAHARYEDPADPERRIELSVFALADPLGAFGLFAAFRAPECAPVRPLGNGGCLGDLQGFFWHGERFVLADAAGPDVTRGADLRRALESAAALLGPPPPRPGPLRAFARVVETRTIRYQPVHLLGREGLPAGLEGRADGKSVFVATGGELPPAALERYAAVLEGLVREQRGGSLIVDGRDPALGPTTLVQEGRRLAGARAARSNEIVELIGRILAQDEGAADDGSW